jgi:hypothetical protein
MGAIYQRASFTMVSLAEKDTTHGLQGVSKPNKVDRKTHICKDSSIYEECWMGLRSIIENSKWYTRGLYVTYVSAIGESSTDLSLHIPRIFQDSELSERCLYSQITGPFMWDNPWAALDMNHFRKPYHWCWSSSHADRITNMTAHWHGCGLHQQVTDTSQWYPSRLSGNFGPYVWVTYIFDYWCTPKLHPFDSTMRRADQGLPSFTAARHRGTIDVTFAVPRVGSLARCTSIKMHNSKGGMVEIIMLLKESSEDFTYFLQTPRAVAKQQDLRLSVLYGQIFLQLLHHTSDRLSTCWRMIQLPVVLNSACLSKRWGFHNRGRGPYCAREILNSGELLWHARWVAACVKSRAQAECHDDYSERRKGKRHRRDWETSN